MNFTGDRMRINKKQEKELIEYFEEKWKLFWKKYIDTFIHDTALIGKFGVCKIFCVNGYLDQSTFSSL